MLTPQQFSQKWSRNLAASGESARAGIDAVTVSPGVVAAENINNYRVGVLSALESGKTEEAMRAVDLGDWKSKTRDIGVPRMVQAATNQAVVRDVEQFASELLPFTQNVKETIARMPKGTLADGKARAMKAIDMMSEFSRRR